ncbi:MULTISPECIES: DUF624 domain-containing protein [unclassified Psychrobacillus]|uniref:YesL family protein n=1 Tax=unclassified Psychrobacillus TaxID=2636677 RepID=UPI00203D7B83|nr:DUF624 domain-containing protein [Psychrobacillus sp. MER TA 171]MCM3359331.1 DUF624 domain-containing protein [Psychrobacillus sp. MER TA 171]
MKLNWDNFNKVAYWMLSLIYLNLLWIMFTVLGLGILGLFPSTVALFGVVRLMIMKEGKEPFKVFQSFWRIFKKDFWKANSFGLFFAFICYFLIFDFQFVQLSNGQFNFLLPALFFILISSILTLLFFFPVYVHFELKYFQYIKQSFLIAITSPLELFGILASTLAMYFFLTFLPGAIPLFSGSLLAYAITVLSFRAFRRIEQKQKVQQEKPLVSKDMLVEDLKS